jgi:hypothetical protein
MLWQRKLTLKTKWPKLHAVAVCLATSIVLGTLIGAVATAIKATMVVVDKAMTLPTETEEAPITKQASLPVPEPNNTAISSIIGKKIFLSLPAMSCQNVGGRLTHFANAWHFTTDDPWILSFVTSCYTLDFIEQPFQHAIPADCIMSEEMVMVCDQEVKALLAKGAVVEVPETEKDRKGFISNMFAIPKKLGGMRSILNLKCLNRLIVYQHFKMEGGLCKIYYSARGLDG